MSTPQLRGGQIITTFGPGAMVDLPDCSVIVGGLDGWRYDPTDIPGVEEPRLVAKLRKLLELDSLTLRKPPASQDDPSKPGPQITVWSFPEWFIVQRPVLTKWGHRARRLLTGQSLVKGKFSDYDRKLQKVVPVRFVRACRKGHVGDIDWKAFVHGGTSTCMRDLWLEERGTSGDLSEVWVWCDCGKERRMNEAALPALNALGRCNGSRPWLGSVPNESCGEPNRLLIRSASNAYFPQLMSVISLGRESGEGELENAVEALWENFLNDVEDVDDLQKMRKRPMVRDALAAYCDADVLKAIQRKRTGAEPDGRRVKDVEFEALAEAKDEIGAEVPDGDFHARALKRDVWDAPWTKAVERVVLVHRLREVIAQLGFTRFEAAGPDIHGELALDVQRASLAQDVSWLPAIENRGEGIFIQFNANAVRDWSERPEVQARGSQLAHGFNLWKKDRETSARDFPKVPYYMLHTLSHLLMTAIALECGYPASSLRERVYAEDGCYGILIYTGSSDAEGTLGGLVETGRAIKGHLHRALELASLCSNDPVCACHAPDKHDPLLLLGAACHGCLLISETSCEQHNDYLDRALVVPTVESSGAAFFQAVV